MAGKGDMDTVMAAMDLAQKNPEAAKAAINATPKILNAADAAKEATKGAGGGSLSEGGMVMAGAAAVAGVGAAVVFGSVAVGAVAAGGAAYAATRSDKVGDVAKSTGKAAIAVAGKAKELDEKHQISNKMKAGGQKLFNKAKEVNEKHHIAEKAGNAITKGMDKVAAACEPSPSAKK
eukprot:gb/GEZN01015196.1/.p1 GENE.gb/GEZN01015196.1/~~gb/GEZN01015196.1/.p1  ORF type:complete len:191 (-),score=48.92 gb/GEZN01015196.1/:337-867(-)